MAASSPLRRRFLPEPLETSSRTSKRRLTNGSDTSPVLSDDSSSTGSHGETLKGEQVVSQLSEKNSWSSPRAERQNGALEGVPSITSNQPQSPTDAAQPQEEQATKKKKFAPQPVETSTRSSKEKDSTTQDSSPAHRPRRKFAPEPVETITKSSRDKPEPEEDVKPKRKFAPQPVETSARSSKEKETDGGAEKPKPKRKFKVEVLGTSTSSSRRRSTTDGSTIPQPTDTQSNSAVQSSPPSRSSSGGRKFSPELVGTAKGSYRRQPVPPQILKIIGPDGEEAPWQAPEPEESRFSAAALAKRVRGQVKSHSYCVPDLPMIESDSSDQEDEEDRLTPELSRSTTVKTRPSQSPDSADLNYADYVLRFAEEVDEKTLRQQVMAAYINGEEHVPVSHFAAEEDDDDWTGSVGRLSIEHGGDPQLFRRMSHADLHLVLQDMRKHHEQLERAKRDLAEDTAGASRFSSAALAARHHLNIHHPQVNKEHEQETEKAPEEDVEFARMRAAASPPMAGEDLKFPFTISPKMTRCDVDQAPRPRRANSDDEEREETVGHEELWSVHIQIKKEPCAGLWGGLCQKGPDTTRPSTPLRSGLQTPANEPVNPFDSSTPRGSRTPGRRPAPWGGMAFLPLTPPRSSDGDGFTSAIDQKLRLEQQIKEQFSNKVITQIYNYLSLGYPPVARPFDEELSKISRIPMSELRREDRSNSGNVRGYVGSPEGEGNGEEDDSGAVRGCRRWEALKLYVYEWARQSPNFASERSMLLGGGGGQRVGTAAWGANAPIRKGSWGL